MKRRILKLCLLVVFWAIVLVGCNHLSPLAPPEWIIGDWSNASEAYNWTFTSDSAVFSVLDTSIDFKELAKEDDVEIRDNATTSTYTITQSFEGTEIGIFKFEKLTSTTLNYSVTANGATAGPTVLYKQ